MSALGQQRTCRGEIAMSTLPPKADIDGARWNVRFVPKAEIIAIKRAYLTRYDALPDHVYPRRSALVNTLGTTGVAPVQKHTGRGS
jgi:hypothetical protein